MIVIFVLSTTIPTGRAAVDIDVRINDDAAVQRKPTQPTEAGVAAATNNLPFQVILP